MFRQLEPNEMEFLQELLFLGRLPDLPYEQARVEFRREGKPVQHESELFPPAQTICILSYDQPEEHPDGYTLAIRIGASVRSFKDRENSTVGERIALVRAIRSEPIGLNP